MPKKPLTVDRDAVVRLWLNRQGLSEPRGAMQLSRLVGRLDPKVHRDRGVLEIKALHLEPGFAHDAEFTTGLREALASLATFCDATDLHLPPGWRS